MQIRDAKRMLLLAIRREDVVMMKQIYDSMQDVPGWTRALDRSAPLLKAALHLHLRAYQTLGERVDRLEAQNQQHQAQLHRHEAQLQALLAAQHDDDAPAYDAGFEAGHDAGYALGIETATRLICHPGDN